jgi:large subunit ribosomal protein L25
MKVVATTRVKQGTSASRRLRRANQVPGIVYGGSAATNISMEHNPLYHSMRVESFHSTILDMEIDGKAERVLLRDAQWHPYKPQILHVDFQRITNDTIITMKVPVHFTGEEVSPAVKTGGAIVSHITTELLVRCLAVNLPEFITVDLSTAELGHAIRVSSIILPEGVKIANRKEDPVLATFIVPGEEEVTPTSAPAAPAAAPATKGAAAKLAAAGAAAPAAGKAPAKAPAKK